MKARTLKQRLSKIQRLRAGQLQLGWERCELDERFPTYLRDHRDEFEDVLL